MSGVNECDTGGGGNGLRGGRQGDILHKDTRFFRPTTTSFRGHPSARTSLWGRYPIRVLFPQQCCHWSCTWYFFDSFILPTMTLIEIFEAHLQHGIQRVVIFDIDLHHGTPSLCNSHPANLESLNSQATAPSRSSGRLMRSPTVKLSRLKAVHQRRRRALRYITAPSTIFSRIHVR